jgi:hypothetical protein
VQQKSDRGLPWFKIHLTASSLTHKEILSLKCPKDPCPPPDPNTHKMEPVKYQKSLGRDCPDFLEGVTFKLSLKK